MDHHPLATLQRKAITSMSIKKVALASATTILAVAVSMIGIAQNAWAESSTMDSSTKALVVKAFAGSLNASEKAALVKDHRDVAAAVPDLASARAVVVLSGPATAVGQVVPMSSTGGCSTYSGWGTLRSLLGFVLYRFDHSAYVCWGGGLISSHATPRYTMSQLDPTITGWTVTDSYVSGVGTSQSNSRIQLRVSHCVLYYGCYAATYPTGTIVAYSNGTASINTTI